jgi:hypothetical protein
MRFAGLMVFAVLLGLGGIAQQPGRVGGRVLDTETGDALPYVKIYNHTLKNGTLTNSEGYFEIASRSLSDSISISFTGYQKFVLALDQDSGFYTVRLVPASKLLRTVDVDGSDDPWIANLLNECRKKQSFQPDTAKAYYQLKSFVNGRQVELIECFYNAAVNGYDLGELGLKAGRIALQQHDHRFFASMESSRAITLLTLFGHNDFFPQSPLAYSKKEMRKKFEFFLLNKYNNDGNDTMLVIRFVPREKNGTLFEGRIWLNQDQKHIEKINLVCNDARHPFIPMFSTDSIKNVDFNITKTFREINGKMMLAQVYFDYHILYNGRDYGYYDVNTNAILYNYDTSNEFLLPGFDFSESTIGDYRKINALPYNSFFWENHNEFALADQQGANKKFYEDSLSVTNQVFFKPNTYAQHGLLEHPYMHWSENRITFREAIPDTAGFVKGNFISDQYKLTAKLFLDVNFYNDSLHLLTAAVFDPYESFYYLPIDNKTLCFINIYFDLFEIQRRKLQIVFNTLTQNTPSDLISNYYQQSRNALQFLTSVYLKEVERGNNKPEMLKWNEIVRKELAIDNIGIFQPYAEAE